MKIPHLALLPLLLVTACAGPKYAQTPTASLQLRHRQCVEFLDHRDNLLTFPQEQFGLMVRGDRPTDRRHEMEAIELELLHRWQTGDPAAYLPIFEPSKHLDTTQANP